MSLTIDYDPTSTERTYPVPKEGTHNAVLADIYDLGMRPMTWEGVTKEVHKVLFIWQVSERDTFNSRLTASQTYTLSLNEKAKLRKVIEGWQGKFPEGPIKGYDLEALIGKPGLITVQHSIGANRTYANVVGVSPLMDGMTGLQIEDYIRVKDRKKDDAPTSTVPTDDGTPF